MLVIPRRCGSFGSSLLLGAMLVSVAPHSVLAQAKESKPPLVTTLPAVVTKPTNVKKNSKPVVVKPTKDVKKDVKVPIVALPKRIPLPPIQKLVPTPPKIALNGPYGETRLLVEGLPAKGVGRDVSSDAEFTLADSKIAEVDGVGIVHALRDGKTVLTARYQGRTVSVPVMVTGVAKAPAPSFVKEVMPILTKTGCNMGACHGAGAGKGGFKLSLLGYDPDADYEVITRGSSARRIARSQPESSLLLRKPAMLVGHKGGLRLPVGSPEYRLLRDWIAKGMPAPAPKEAHVVQLEVFPKVRTLALGQTQRFTVKAVFDDGTKRDVTGETVFTPSEESVVAVSPSGEAKVNGLGEGAVLIRYQGLVAVARVISPFSTPRTLASKDGKRKIASSLTPDTQHPTPALPIDRLVSTKLTALGLETSGKSTDSDFLRRAYLDAIGILPTPDEVRAFLADHDTSKREKLIDVLLERPEYVDFWTLKWGDILRSSSRILNEKGMYAFNHWLRRSVAENKPWNQFAQELLLAKGSALEGPANFFRTANSPQELAETTSQVFLGVRIQCAKCHNHPYEKWTQNQYYQMAAFFARVHSKQGDNPEDKVYYTSQSGEVTHPKTKNQVIPAALDAAPITADFHGDRRQPLVDWLTSAKNPFFSHILVNRVWRHFMGRGFVEPVDDLRATNPPSNEALFDWLAQDFAAHNFDLKYLMRSIMLSQTYQRSAEPTKGNDLDTKYYSHYPFKRLGAEQLMDAISTATGVPEKFGNYPKGMRAAELPDTGVESYFLDLFGRPARQVTCECERQDAPNVGQVLHLMNSKDVNDRITAKTGRVAQLLEAKAPFPKLMEELYLTAFSRFPTAEESKQGVQTLTVAKDKQKAGEDLLWVLLNSKEFIFSH